MSDACVIGDGKGRAPQISAVCVDLDGTLLDTIPDLAAAVNRMLVDLALAPLPEDRIRLFVGKGAEVLIQRALSAAGASPIPVPGDPLFEAGKGRFFANYRSLNGDQARLYDGVREGLQGLRAMGLMLACITNKPEEFVRPLLQRFGIDGCFDFAIGGDTLPFRKPHPGQLLEACRRWALAPERVVAVGDSTNDAEAARAAGMAVYLVPYGYNEGRSVEDVDGIVPSLSELPALIQARNARAS